MKATNKNNSSDFTDGFGIGILLGCCLAFVVWLSFTLTGCTAPVLSHSIKIVGPSAYKITVKATASAQPQQLDDFFRHKSVELCPGGYSAHNKNIIFKNQALTINNNPMSFRHRVLVGTVRCKEI